MNSKILLDQSKADEAQILRDRRWLHAHPGTGFNIQPTVDYVRAQLEVLGCTVHPCGKAGLYTDIGRDGRRFLLRADMDGLPIREESGLDFAAKNGCAHACGHDFHTAMLLEAARLLKAREDELPGTVRLMFQPAEEIFEGSQDMIDHGVLRQVDAAMMIHVMAGVPLPAGQAIVSPAGVSAPAADYFEIRVQGVGCHGSMPSNGVDSLTAAAHILIALQEIQARELSIADRAVLTVGQFHGGTASNAIADSAVLGGTLRTFDEAVRARIKTRLTEISQGVAAAFRAKAQVVFGSGCPTLVNDAGLSQAVGGYLEELLGPAPKLGALQGQSGGSEDFAYVSHQVPSIMVALAAGEPDKGYSYPQHHPQVRFDESVLPVGSAVYAWSAIRWLEEHPL